MHSKTLIVIAAYMLSFYLASAQHYQSYKSNTRYTYHYTLHLVFKANTMQGQDSIFHTYDNIWKNDYEDCWNTVDGSFMGKTVTIGHDGFDIFVNKAGDSIKINRNAQVGKKWMLYQSDTLLIEATVSRHDTVHFLGQTDSVKAINLVAYDTAMKPITHWISTITEPILLSKNHGLIRTPPFRVFPDFSAIQYSVSTSSLTAQPLNLIGMTNPHIGFNDLGPYDVFDFQVGDELHILEYDNASLNPRRRLKIKEVKTIVRYTDRKEYLPDSIIYNTQIYRHRSEIWEDSVANESSSEIGKQKVTLQHMLSYPSEVSFSSNHFYLSHDGKSKTLSDIYNSLYGYDTCSVQPIADGCFSPEVYLKGKGGPYHYCQNTLPYGEIHARRLVYSRKGNIETGTPFTDVGITEFNAAAFDIYPNPTSSLLNVRLPENTFSGPVQFEIYSIIGKPLLEQANNADKNAIYTIDVPTLPAGNYILRIITPTASFHRKFSITH